MSEQSVNLGGTPSAAGLRDALHICCISGIAGENLYPGSAVKPVGDRWFNDDSKDAFAIMDPYREERARIGDTFWVCLKPNTVSAVQHVWEHPLLPLPEVPVRTTKPECMVEPNTAIIQKVASLCGLSYEAMMSYANQTYSNLQEGYEDCFHMGTNEDYSDVTDSEWQTFWEAYRKLTGVTGKLPEYIPFSCSC